MRRNKPVISAEEKAALDAEFEKSSVEIIAKMQEATKLIEDSNTLAKKTHQNLRDFLYDERVSYGLFELLLGELDAGGWSTSSIGC